MARAKKQAKAAGEKREDRFDTPEKLQALLDGYFAECERKNELPNEFSLGVYLGVTMQTLDQWYSGSRRPYLQETLQLAYMRMSSMWMDEARLNPKFAMPIFLLKQKRFGGYQDKIEANAEVNVNVKMGAGMEASDFA